MGKSAKHRMHHAICGYQQRQMTLSNVADYGFACSDQVDAAGDDAASNAALVATKRALSGLCEKGLLKFKWEDGNRDGRYQALALGKAAFAASLEPVDAVDIQKELDRCVASAGRMNLLGKPDERIRL